MKLNSASFDVSYKRKRYKVHFQTQAKMHYTVTVSNAEGKTLAQFSCEGRQIVSLWNAGELVKQTVKEQTEQTEQTES